MNRNACIFCFLILAIAAGSGCSSGPSADAKKAAKPAPDKIQGKAQVLIENNGAMDAALNAGGSSVYIWEGTRRYRLFLKAPYEFVHGDEYIVEGINAQKAIDEIGDPDNGANGYPLLASCEKVVNTVWGGTLAMDTLDLHAQTLKARVNRYPARAVFLVTKIQLVQPEGDAAKKTDKKDKEKEIPEITVPADKGKALLVEGPPNPMAPLWEPKGADVKCRIQIGPDGKISELQTGTQLCEAVDWSKYKYQPTTKAGKPVRVATEVEVKFEPRK